VLLTVGPNRLYKVLGQEAYNALVPMGGLSLLALVTMLVESESPRIELPCSAGYFPRRSGVRGIL
jgi:hypothetical protein